MISLNIMHRKRNCSEKPSNDPTTVTMCHGAQSCHRGTQPLAAPQGSCCFASVKSCQTPRRELDSSLGDPDKPKLAMPTPLCLPLQHSHCLSSGRVEKGCPSPGCPALGTASSQASGAGPEGSGLLGEDLEEAGGPPQPGHGLEPQVSHAPSGCAAPWAGVTSTRHNFQLLGRFSPARPNRQ